MPFLVFAGFVVLLSLLNFDQPKSSTQTIVKSKFKVGDEVSVMGGLTGDASTFTVADAKWNGSEWDYTLSNGNTYKVSKLAMVTPA